MNMRKIKINKKFIFIFSYFLIGYFVFCGFFNYLVNPYGIFKTSPGKLNYYKIQNNIPKNIINIISLKFDKRKIDTIFIGNEKIEHAIDSKYFEKLSGKTCINIASNDLIFDEYLNYLKLILKIHPEIKNVYINTDFLLFNSKYQTNNYNSKYTDYNSKLTLDEIYTVLFSFSCFKNSIKTVFGNLCGKTDSMISPRGLSNTMEKQTNQEEYFWQNLSSYTDIYKEYQYSYEKENIIISLINYCQTQNIKIHILIMPTHITDMQLMQNAGIYNIYLNWKKNLSEIIPIIYDFQYPCEVTNETISNIMQYFYLPDTVTPQTGKMIIEEIIKDDKDFGRFYTYNYADIFNDSDKSELEMLIDENIFRTDMIKNL